MKINRLFNFPEYGFVAVVIREIKLLISSKSLLLLNTVFPLGMIILLGFFFRKADISGIRMAIVDNDKSEISRLFTRYIESTSTLEIKNFFQSPEEARNEMMRGNIDGIFFFPENLEKDLKKGLGAKVVLYINTTALLKANYIYRDGFQITKTISGGVLLQKLRKAGLSESQAMSIVNPIKIDTEALFNPYMSYSGYLYPALAIVTLQTLLMMLSVLLISKETQNKTLNNLFQTAKGKILVIIAGKAVPHLLIHFLNAAVIIFILFRLFNVPVGGSLAVLYLFVVFFLTIVFILGFALGVIFDDSVRATEISLFVNIPAFIFSGLTFPIWGMPLVHNLYAQIIPFTHFSSGFLKILMMDAPIKYLAPEIKILLGFFITGLTISVTGLYFKKKKLAKEMTEGNTIYNELKFLESDTN